MRVVAFAIALAGCAFAQPIGFGLKLGAPLTDAASLANGSGNLANTATRFTIGPMVDVRLPFGVGVEADFLYRRVDSSYTVSALSAGVSGNQWDLPILLKYRFAFPIIRPYIEAGPSFRWLTNVNHNYSCSGVECAAIAITFGPDKNGAGLTFGGGVELHLLLIRIAPELRYTRWGSQAFSVQSGGSDLLHANQNQAEFLVGISF
jgi:opacity protein-like surface antigen